MPSPDTPRVFISYSNKDTRLVDGLKAALAQAGVDVWLDHERLTPETNDWQEAVRKGILQSTHVIYVASPDAARSQYVIHEVTMAKGEKKPVFAFWIRGDDDKWYDCAPFGWISTQYIDGRGGSLAAGLTALIAALGVALAAATAVAPAASEPPVASDSHAAEVHTPAHEEAPSEPAPAPATSTISPASSPPVIDLPPVSEPASAPPPTLVRKPAPAPVSPAAPLAAAPPVIEPPSASKPPPAPAATATPAATPPASEPASAPATPPATPGASPSTRAPRQVFYPKPASETPPASESASGGLLARYSAAHSEPPPDSARATGAPAAPQSWWRRVLGGQQPSAQRAGDWRASDFAAGDLGAWDQVSDAPFEAPPDLGAAPPRGRGSGDPSRDPRRSGSERRDRRSARDSWDDADRRGVRGQPAPRSRRDDNIWADDDWDDDWDTSSWDTDWSKDSAGYPLPSVPTRLFSLGFRGVNAKGTPAIIPPLVSVRAGAFLMGSDQTRDPQARSGETPQQRVELAAFQIAKYPVTVAEYALAVSAGGVREPQELDGMRWQAQLQRPDHPVVCIAWQDAQSYIRWLREVTGESGWRLPTEAEWEKAARWNARYGVSRIYPWGDNFQQARCNTLESGVGHATPVGSYLASDARRSGASPCGAEEMAGGVWELTSSLYKPYPYASTDGREAEDASGFRTVRGGSWAYIAEGARAAHRSYVGQWGVAPGVVGFRLAFSPPSAGWGGG